MSRQQRRWGGAVRSVFGVFALMTSFYCLLAYIPFTYIQFLQFPHLRWLTAFVRVHHLLFLLLAGLVIVSFSDELRRPRRRRLVGIIALLLALTSVLLLLRPLLPNLRNDATSLAWAFFWLVPVGLLAAADLIAGWPRVAWAVPAAAGAQRVFVAAAGAALMLAVIYPVTAWLRYGATTLGLAPGPTLVVWLMNLLSYLTLFAALFLCLDMCRAVAALARRPSAVEFVLYQGLFGLVVFALVRDVVLPGVSFTGLAGTAYAAAFAAATVAFVTGRKAHDRASSGVEVGDGLELALAPLATRRSSAGRAAAVAAIPLAVYVLSVRTAAYDWDFIVQKIGVAAVLVIAFGAIYGALPQRVGQSRLGFRAMITGSVVVLVAFIGTRAWLVQAETLDRYAGHDVAFTFVHDLLSAPAPESDPNFYAFLQANTNISRAVRVEPVEVDLVEDLQAVPGPAPNIFIIVIDSLRQDYLSAYNEAVDFTPELDDFARDSIVFRNAFTHYGATGLSQPSIWVGGMILHQQYPSPFHPMNALDKLLQAHDYERYVSLDTILRAIMRDPTDTVQIDEGKPDKDFDLCDSLDSLESRITRRSDTSRPIFAYTQPHNMHISAVTREGNAPIDDGDYAGFHAPNASRLRRLDSCIGGFLEYLRSSGLYEESIVVLTSDHGDSLGEEGRWGHAYTIFPEVIRIPLLMHVPEGLASGWVWDDSAPVFSTDITPSLYALLGHELSIDRSFMGRSLFGRSQAELGAGTKPTYMVASSYGAVYGILDDDARTLFIADGVNYTDHLYDLSAGFSGRERRPSDEERRRYRALIRAEIGAIGNFYGYLATEPGGSSSDGGSPGGDAPGRAGR